MSDTQKELRLQVVGAQPEDVGRGVARLGDLQMRQLGLVDGDVIEIKGKRITCAVALRQGVGDLQVGIRLDGLQRSNTDVGLGEHVVVRKADARPARTLRIAPADKNVRLHGSPELLRRALAGRPLVAGDIIGSTVATQRTLPPEGARTGVEGLFYQPSLIFQELRLVVVASSPRGIVTVGPGTRIEMLPEYAEVEDLRRGEVTYEDLGGMGGTIGEIREMIELPLKHPELFQRLGIHPPKGILLHGPAGTGKTLLARAVANESDASFFSIAGPEIMGRHYGESEQRLRDIFEQAEEAAPAILFIDEIDSISPKRSEVTGEVERRIVAQLLTLLDGLEPRKNVVVIGATNRIDSIDEALRRPGRFDREIVIGVPDLEGRRQVLAIHTRGMPLDEAVDREQIARETYGFVGADLAALCREAAIEALRRSLPLAGLDAGNMPEEIPEEILADIRVIPSDFSAALRRVQPSAMREIMIQIPEVRWDGVGGLEDAKQTLREGIELPLRHPEAFARIGIRPASGFLLYGPPGTGKTLLAQAVAREAEANFIATKSSDLLSKWYGESEKQISRLFARARQVAPAVIFIDEIDSLAPQRGGGMGEPAVTERVINTLLAEMDGLEEHQRVVVIGATNRPALLDPALLRPGRFDELVYIPVPDLAARARILRIHTREMPLGPDVDLDDLARRSQGYTGADLEDLVRRAGLGALREDMGCGSVPMRFFDAALGEIRASVSSEMEREYDEIAGQLKREGPGGGRRIGFAHPGNAFAPRESRVPRPRGDSARARAHGPFVSEVADGRVNPVRGRNEPRS